MSEWNGRPPGDDELLRGWHWLQRRRDGAFRMAFFAPLDGWRVADAIGRTRIVYDARVAKLYVYVERAPAPSVHL